MVMEIRRLAICFATIAIAIMLALPAAATGGTTNLAPNPDFSLADPDHPEKPLGWEATVSLFDFNQPMWDHEVAYVGERSLRMSAPLETEAHWQSVPIAVRPQTEYRLTGYVRTERLVPERPRFYGTLLVEAFSDRGPLFPRPLAAGPSLGGDNDWTEVSFTFRTPARTETVRIYGVIAYSGRAKGSIWFDGITLEEVVQP